MPDKKPNPLMRTPTPAEVISAQSSEIKRLRIAVQAKDKRIWGLNEKVEDLQVQIKSMTQTKREDDKELKRLRRRVTVLEAKSKK